MGNSPVFSYRLPALAAACLATTALSLAVTAGATCSFVHIVSKQGHTLTVFPGTGTAQQIPTNTIGVLCEGGLFYRAGDQLWTVSFIFFLVSVTLGSCATALAWAVSIILPPTNVNWNWLSIVAAIAAVMQVPVFVLIDARPCNLNGNHCTPGLGFYLLIASTVLWVGVTLLTQCLDPPLWAHELNAWRVQKHPERSPRPSKRDRGVLLTDNEFVDADDLPTMEQPSRVIVHPFSFAHGIRKWAQRRRWAYSEFAAPKKSMPKGPQDENHEGDLAEMGSYYANSCNSRLLLKVLPNGKLPGDDQKSIASFCDLDSIVNLAEAERMELGLEPQALSMSILSEDVTSCTVQSSTVDESIPSEECKPMYSGPDALQSSALDICQNEEGEDKTSKAKEIDSSRSDQDLLFENMEQDESPRKKLAAGIRALTDKMKLDSIRRLSRDSRAYYLIDDNNISKSLPLPPIEVTITTLIPIGKDLPFVTPSEGKASPSGQNTFQKVFSCVAGGDQRCSSSEDEPESIYFSGEEDNAEAMSSMGRQLESDDDDVDETSTLSTSSDSEDHLAEDDIVERRSRRSTLRARRAKLRSSSLCSLKSHPSLLEMTIDEETDLELRAFESSDDEKFSAEKRTEPYPITRTLSETDAIEMRRRPHSADNYADSFSTSAVEGCLRHVGRFSRSPYVLPKLGSLSRVVPLSDNMEELVQRGSDDNEDLLVSLTGEIPRDGKKFELSNAVNDEIDPPVPMKKKRGRSLSIPRRADLLTLDIPDDESDDIRLMSWKEERMYKDGIHAGPVIVSDDSSSEGRSRSERSETSGLSNISQKARMARVQRLQQEVTRRRAKTLEPPKNRQRSKSPAYSFLMDTLDLRLAQVARPDGVEYGPDEISL